jgi:2'-5' RNA ligase
MGDTVRAFIAVELPSNVIDLAADLQSCLKRQGLALRWVRPQNMHLTLKFLGEIRVEMVPVVSAAMAQAASGASPMALAVQGMGVFPNARNPRVVWIGVGGAADRLQQTVVALDSGLASLGIEREKKPFKAHLTLARINAPVDARQLLEAIQRHGNYAPQSFNASEMVLFQSDLKPKGPVYTPLAKVALGAQV